MPRRMIPLIRLPLLLVGVAVASGCVPAAQRASWWIYPLPRHQPNDGLAVVNRPGGVGLHIWIDTDTSQAGVCRPRWNPDAARLFDGNGAAPRSSGRASRDEFYEAMAQARVRWALRRQLAALCRMRAPLSRFLWSEPPLSPQEFRPPTLPMLEERHLLSDPKAVIRAEKRLLGLPLLPEDFEEDHQDTHLPGP
jgi:hypothetical protein